MIALKNTVYNTYQALFTVTVVQGRSDSPALAPYSGLAPKMWAMQLIRVPVEFVGTAGSSRTSRTAI